MLLPLRQVLILLLLAGALSACGAPPTIHVDGKMPPTFSFTGSSFAEHKHLQFFFVTEEASNTIIWRIWPDTYSNGDVDHLPTVTYGQVPAGWTQKTPEYGQPPPLVEGKTYRVGGPPVDSHLAYMRFTIRDGKFVTLPLHED